MSAELLDIYTADGIATGRTAPRGAELAAGEYYLGAHMYVYDAEGRFLLQRRAPQKEYLPGAWDICMGHVDAGETGAQGARRELREELGIDVPEAALRHVARFVWNKYNHLVDVFFLRVEPRPARLRLQPDEVDAVQWVSAEEMLRVIAGFKHRPQAYRDMVALYIRAALLGEVETWDEGY